MAEVGLSGILTQRPQRGLLVYDPVAVALRLALLSGDWYSTWNGGYLVFVRLAPLSRRCLGARCYFCGCLPLWLRRGKRGHVGAKRRVSRQAWRVRRAR